MILRMQVLGFGEIEAFPFIDPPDSRLISDGYRLLEELGGGMARNPPAAALPDPREPS